MRGLQARQAGGRSGGVTPMVQRLLVIGTGLGRSAAEPGGPQCAAIAAVAAEQLIAAFAGQDDGEGPLGRLGELVGGQARVVGGGIIQRPGDRRQDPPEVRFPEGGLAPVQIQRPGHPLGLRPLIRRAGGVEAAGEGGDRPVVQPGHQGGDGGAVDAAGEEQAIGDV